MSNQIFSLQTADGETIVLSGYQVTPQSQALTIRLPFGGFVWNRPVAVKVKTDTSEETIPIVDATLVTKIAIYLFAAFLTLILMRRR